MSCTLFLCQEAKWTDINQPIVQSYAILLDWQIPTSHILTGHKFPRCNCCRGRDLVSVSSLWVQSGGWVWVCAAASSLPDCFEAGCLGVYEVRPRGCSCPLSSAVSSVSTPQPHGRLMWSQYLRSRIQDWDITYRTGWFFTKCFKILPSKSLWNS